jgi:hypothetical protein
MGNRKPHTWALTLISDGTKAGVKVGYLSPRNQLVVWDEISWRPMGSMPTKQELYTELWSALLELMERDA